MTIKLTSVFNMNKMSNVKINCDQDISPKLRWKNKLIEDIQEKCLREDHTRDKARLVRKSEPI